MIEIDDYTRTLGFVDEVNEINEICLRFDGATYEILIDRQERWRCSEHDDALRAVSDFSRIMEKRFRHRACM